MEGVSNNGSNGASHTTWAMMELTNSIAVSMSLRAMAKLDVPKIIWQNGENTPLTALEIATKLGSEAGSSNLERMLRLLTAHGVFNETMLGPSEGRRFSLTGLGREIVDRSMGAFILYRLDDALLDAWRLLHEAVLEPSSEPFIKAHGKPAYHYHADDPVFNERMMEAMSSSSGAVMDWFLERYDGFEGVRRVVDLGGSSGFCLKKILDKHKGLEGINFDLPKVVEAAPPYLGIEHVGGDMLEWVPQGDVIFMKGILCSWDDDECVGLLKNCYKALPEKGKVIALEQVLPMHTDTSPSTRALLQADVFLMAIYSPGSKRRTEDIFRRLSEAAGFRTLEIVLPGSFYTALEFQK
ncbi:hypothetical protein AMTRI_Chr03g147070 [Amborella trichopoda]|uniref:O-methyltransferase domain-containing protein n=1 Tax=Amborella trichopoda TaxID=13333 RepID=W1P041_AMBTC|nr:flavone 3'-O-methyltransferase 1 [Amborella trichopoda]ERN01298.1 hypothetical protein AMTR_s00002p00253410 [Amborella trichopoda]|eukprot:XP_006838729.1 flavone 3'-O-methyltransferase 1 [Amborella trichopoda]